MKFIAVADIGKIVAAVCHYDAQRSAPMPKTVTLHVPFRVVKRGGRKEMQLPEGAAQP